MKNVIINAGNAQYLSQIKEFSDGLPHGVLNKVKTDAGGTYLSYNCKDNYIIVVPFKGLVDSIVKDSKKYEVFGLYGGVKGVEEYINTHEVKKIAVTWDSLYKLDGLVDSSYKILIDEFHLILQQMDFREDAINAMLDRVSKFNHYTFMSATPIGIEFEVDFMKNLPHYEVKWENQIKIQPFRFKTPNTIKSICRLIQIFNSEGLRFPDINGNLTNVEELYIFFNSVKTIEQICKTLELPTEDVKICCANRLRNRMILDKYQINSITEPNRKINFFTSAAFEGCNLFSNNGLVIVCSDCHKTQTLVDISTTLEQISGRLRTNEKYNNVFKHILVHFYSTDRAIETDEEFAEMLATKKIEANSLISLFSKGTEEEHTALMKRLDISGDVVSYINGELTYNTLKEKSFTFKHKIRAAYRDGYSIRAAYNESSRFADVKQEYWNDINIKLKPLCTFGYQDAIMDYYVSGNEEWEQEYPEFKEYRLCGITLQNCATLRYNKEKLLAKCEEIHNITKIVNGFSSYGFISNAFLKEKLGKASNIRMARGYNVEPAQKKVDGKKVTGYNVERELNFAI